jgi:hypothetical protein
MEYFRGLVAAVKPSCLAAGAVGDQGRATSLQCRRDARPLCSRSDEGAESGLPGELLTRLLTPGEWLAQEPSRGAALPAKDRPSSKQPVVGSNPTGGVPARA